MKEAFYGLGMGIGVFLALAAPAAFAGTEHSSCAKMPEGFHEYAVFGQHSVYLYHYLALGSIHSYEMIEQVSLTTPDGKDASSTYFAGAIAHPGVGFTISPIRAADRSDDYWVLPEYTRTHAEFTAHLHYTDAGTDKDLIPLVTVRVRKVWVNRLLMTPSDRPERLTYFYIGDQTEGFLVHRITWDPDFDQILSISPLSPAEKCDEVTIPSEPEDESNRLGAKSGTVAAMCGNRAVPVKVLGELFEYKTDLEH